jgi:hypothetical protein
MIGMGNGIELQPAHLDAALCDLRRSDEGEDQYLDKYLPVTTSGMTKFGPNELA